MGWFQYEFWRFVFVQQEVGKLVMSAIDYPPMQKGASFNLDAVKARVKQPGHITGSSRSVNLRARNFRPSF
jgi:hypothetical protein